MMHKPNSMHSYFDYLEKHGKIPKKQTIEELSELDELEYDEETDDEDLEMDLSDSEGHDEAEASEVVDRSAFAKALLKKY